MYRRHSPLTVASRAPHSPRCRASLSSRTSTLRSPRSKRSNAAFVLSLPSSPLHNHPQDGSLCHQTKPGARPAERVCLHPPSYNPCSESRSECSLRSATLRADTSSCPPPRARPCPEIVIISPCASGSNSHIKNTLLYNLSPPHRSMRAHENMCRQSDRHPSL